MTGNQMNCERYSFSTHPTLTRAFVRLLWDKLEIDMYTGGAHITRLSAWAGYFSCINEGKMACNQILFYFKPDCHLRQTSYQQLYHFKPSSCHHLRLENEQNRYLYLYQITILSCRGILKITISNLEGSQTPRAEKW